MFKLLLNTIAIGFLFFTASAYAGSENFYYVSNPNPEKYDLKWSSNPANGPDIIMYKSSTTTLYECQRVRGHRGPDGPAGEGAWDPIYVTFVEKSTGLEVCGLMGNEAGQYPIQGADGHTLPMCPVIQQSPGSNNMFVSALGSTPLDITSICHPHA